MRTSRENRRFTQSLLALAVLAAIGQAQAQEPTTGTQASVTVGGAIVSGDPSDRARFGLYNGLRQDTGYGLFDFSYLNRDASSGIWTTIDGRNLFLDTREAGLWARKPGDWKVGAEYSEILRSDPRTINTGAQGMGGNSITYTRLATPGTGQEVNLEQKRKGISLFGSAWFGGALQFEASFKSEDKDGAKMGGRGFACSATWVAAGTCAATATQSQWALLAMPEAINSNIKQGDAKLTFAQGGLLLTAGYYGNIYTNSNSYMSTTVVGTLNNPLGNPQNPLDAGLRATLQLPYALPPDSQAHQWYLQGAYRFSPTTALNFKYAYTKATQDEDFAASGFPAFPPGQSNLGGEVDTTIAQAGISSRPMPKLTLTANVRYEKREDKTPIAVYNVEGNPATTSFTNSTASPKKTEAKIEASYLLPYNVRLLGGYQWKEIDHGEFTPTSSVAGLSGLRDKLKEDGYKIELRRSMSEEFTGWITYTSSNRKGDGPWMKPLSLSQGRGVIEANDDPACVPPAAPAINNCIYNRTGIFPFFMEDLKRDKTKVMGNWIPSDDLSVQFYAEASNDKYSGPTEHGLRSSDGRLYNLDGAYRVADGWSLTGYATYGKASHQSGHSTGYDGDVKDKSTAFGFGLKGMPNEKLLVNADLAYLKDDLEYKQEIDPLGSATNAAFLALTGGLPDVTYKVLRFRITGDFFIDKQSSVRLAYVFEKSDFNEWTWQWNGNSFLFSDNTTVGAKEKQRVNFVGATYTYRFK